MRYLLLLFLFQLPDTIKIPTAGVMEMLRQIEIQRDSVFAGQKSANIHYMDGQQDILVRVLNTGRQQFRESAKKDSVKTKIKKEK